MIFQWIFSNRHIYHKQWMLFNFTIFPIFFIEPKGNKWNLNSTSVSEGTNIFTILQPILWISKYIVLQKFYCTRSQNSLHIIIEIVSNDFKISFFSEFNTTSAWTYVHIVCKLQTSPFSFAGRPFV